MKMKINKKVNDDFDGLSRKAMNLLLRENQNDEENVVSINPKKLNGNEVPLIKQIRFYLGLLENAGVTIITPRGNIPIAIVKKLCENNPRLSDYLTIFGSTPIFEHYVPEISAMRYFCESTGIVKKRKSRLSLTAKGVEIMNTHQLFDTIFNAAFYKYNWALLDWLQQDDEIGIYGRNYTLYLLSKYGNEWREVSFYRDKYFKAFPKLLKGKIEQVKDSYELRTFDKILSMFGFVSIKKSENKTKLIKATTLFRKYIVIKFYLL